MRKIEDIKRVKKKVAKKSEVFEPSFSADEFYAESPSLPIPEPEIPAPRFIRPKKAFNKIIGKIIFFFLACAVVSVACFIFAVEAKNKISKEFLTLNSKFSTFSENISSKNIAALSSQIKEIDVSTSRALLILQSTGQDVYCLHYLYPKGQGSKSTMMIDVVRSAHLLTSSYKEISENDGASKKSSGSDYLAKINIYLANANVFFSGLPQKLKIAGVLSAEAKNITDGINTKEFLSSETGALGSLSKLAGLSSDFFNYLSQTSDDFSQALTLSGGNKSYLILFLNNAEIRPGGGFIGSFARLDLSAGKASALDFQTNIYSLDKVCTSKNLGQTPPEEYQTLVPTICMRDSNYYYDFADSSKNIIDFYQKESGRNVDGIISIDTTFFRELLKITGPIEMPEYNMTVNDENFMSDVQYQVEIGYYQNDQNKVENQPKKILADMMPKVVAELTSGDIESGKLSTAISKAIAEKHLLIYHESPNIEDLLDGINLAGKIHQPKGDYLYVTNSNLGGMKSSLNVAQTVNQTVKIDTGGNISESLSVIRKHNGSYEWPDGVNKNYTKVFLPLAAKVSTNELKTGAESSKTTVSFWQNTKPGETTKIDLSYRRDSALSVSGDSFDWQILIQKQPGEIGFDWNLQLEYPKGWKPQNVEGYDSVKHQISLSERISKDTVFQLRFIRD